MSVGMPRLCQSACGLAAAGREGIGHGGGGLAVAFLERRRRNVCTVALLRRRQREGRAVAVVGIPRSCRGRDVHTVVELKSSSGYVQRCRGGRHGSSCAVLTGQEGSGVGLKKRSDNQHVVGGGVCQGAGVGGGTASSRVDVFVQQ